MQPSNDAFAKDLVSTALEAFKDHIFKVGSAMHLALQEALFVSKCVVKTDASIEVLSGKFFFLRSLRYKIHGYCTPVCFPLATYCIHSSKVDSNLRRS